MNDQSLVTLITGASSGIGAATARRLLAAGHRVAVTGRDPGRLAALADDLSVGSDRLLTVTGDATEYADVAAAVRAAVEGFGRLDAVVANAGFSAHDTLADGDPARWRELVLTNVLGPALLVRAALPALRESGGRIVFVGSTAGVKNTPGNLYSVTKWAVSALAENTRVLVTRDGVGVTLVAPGRVDTPFWSDHPAGHAPDGPVLTPDQIADAIAWAVGQPAGVDVNTLVIRPVGQVV
ncbi:MAG: SDR family oxidoreductase [Mycobacteriales bacterium]